MALVVQRALDSYVARRCIAREAMSVSEGPLWEQCTVAGQPRERYIVLPKTAGWRDFQYNTTHHGLMQYHLILTTTAIHQFAL